MKPRYLWVDQNGNNIYATTLKELAEEAGYPQAKPFAIYRDKLDGTTVKVGYGIRDRWFTKYALVEEPA